MLTGEAAGFSPDTSAIPRYPHASAIVFELRRHPARTIRSPASEDLWSPTDIVGDRAVLRGLVVAPGGGGARPLRGPPEEVPPQCARTGRDRAWDPLFCPAPPQRAHADSLRPDARRNKWDGLLPGARGCVRCPLRGRRCWRRRR